MPVLPHSPADVLRQLLVDLGLGSEPAALSLWPVYATSEPSSPDNCLTTYDTTGLTDARLMVTGEAPVHHGFQVRVRSADHQSGWAKANAVRTALAESVYQHTVHVGASAYLVHAVARIGDVLTLGSESPTSKRRLFTLNAVVTLQAL